MKITGVVAEYNPFHRGHEYQLKAARRLSSCDYVAVVMSGNFVQRGEPAIIDKYKRAAAAVCGGADLVIELPLPFACQNAELFAQAAISELSKLNITHLSFGCEDADIEMLKEAASIQLNSREYNAIIREELKKGISYPRALTNSIGRISSTGIEDIISSPNNVLGIEYIKSSYKLNLSLDFIPVKRIGKNHNDESLSGRFDSATAIRRGIFSNEGKVYRNSLTEKSLEMIRMFYDEHGGFNCLDNYLNYIYYKILTLGQEGLNSIYEVSEGLNNKIYSNVFKHTNADDFIMSLKSKRYTYSKLRRILLNILLGITKNHMEYFKQTNSIDFANGCCISPDGFKNYVKVLAFNDRGRLLLRELKDSGTYFVKRFSDYKKYDIGLDAFNLTDMCSNIYYLPFASRKSATEHTLNAVYIKNQLY